MYVKIIGNDEHYNETLESFTTQHGYPAVRFVGDEIPETDKGFEVYNDNDEELYDLSKYKYIYRQNEYSVEHDEIEQPVGNNDSIPSSSSSVYDGLNARIDYIASQVADITPYTETRQVYIDDTEVVFTKAKEGSISAWLTVDGIQTPCEYEVTGNTIRVYFEPLEMIGTVTIQIQ